MSEFYPSAVIEAITAEEAGEVQTQADPAAPFLKTLFRTPLKEYNDDSVSLRAVDAVSLDMHVTNMYSSSSVPVIVASHDMLHPNIYCCFLHSISALKISCMSCICVPLYDNQPVCQTLNR